MTNADTMTKAEALRLTPKGVSLFGVELQAEDREASLQRGGDGRVAKLDGGWLDIGVNDQDSFGSVFDDGEYTLHLRIKPSGTKLDGCFFSRWAGREHMPIDFSVWRMPWGHLSTEGISFRACFKRNYAAGQAAVLDFYCPIKEATAGWHDLTVRLSPKVGSAGTLDLFVNGKVLFRNADKQPDGLPYDFFLNEIIGAHIGAEPGGRWPFRGLIDHVAIWSRALTDAEVLGLAGAAASPETKLVPEFVHERDLLGQYHLPASTPHEDRDRLNNEELPKAIASQIANALWYPQYHIPNDRRPFSQRSHSSLVRQSRFTSFKMEQSPKSSLMTRTALIGIGLARPISFKRRSSPTKLALT